MKLPAETQFNANASRTNPIVARHTTILTVLLIEPQVITFSSSPHLHPSLTSPLLHTPGSRACGCRQFANMPFILHSASCSPSSPPHSTPSKAANMPFSSFFKRKDSGPGTSSPSRTFSFRSTSKMAGSRSPLNVFNASSTSRPGPPCALPPLRDDSC